MQFPATPIVVPSTRTEHIAAPEAPQAQPSNGAGPTSATQASHRVAPGTPPLHRFRCKRGPNGEQLNEEEAKRRKTNVTVVYHKDGFSKPVVGEWWIFFDKSHAVWNRTVDVINETKFFVKGKESEHLHWAEIMEDKSEEDGSYIVQREGDDFKIEGVSRRQLFAMADTPEAGTPPGKPEAICEQLG